MVDRVLARLCRSARTAIIEVAPVRELLTVLGMARDRGYPLCGVTGDTVAVGRCGFWSGEDVANTGATVAARGMFQ